MDAELELVDVDSRPIAYRRAGSGPPLVLLHGAWSDGREWRRQLEELSDEFTVIAWDAPGCGGSWDPPDEFPLAAYADVVAGFVDAIGVVRPHVLGLSFGGGLALEVYRRHPSLPRSLVLASAYAGWAGSLPREEVAARVRRVLDEAARPPAEWAPGYLPGFFAGAVPQAARDEVLEIMLDVRPTGSGRWSRPLLPPTCATRSRPSRCRRSSSTASSTREHHAPSPSRCTPASRAPSS